MKRSEVISHINKWFMDDNIKNEDKAVMLLMELEQLGMQPPAVKEPCTTEVLYNGRYVKAEDSFIFTHKWDEE